MASVLYSFRESSLFTKDVSRYLTEDSYFALQEFLLYSPAEGDLIRGSGGLRKLRWRAEGRGKRGGTRVIYYWADARGYIFFLDIYPKNEQEDLTPDEIKQLRALVEEWLHE
jgi:mRNA-degrading endonuclease RelE of RelBE toxin-antitoxin system